MKRCAQTAFAAALATPFTLIPAEADAASAGCNTLNGVMATDVPDGMSTFTARTVTLKKGEKITVTTTGGGAGTDTRVTIDKQPGGNVFNDQYNNAGNTTFTIPSDGTYVVTVENNAVGANSKIAIGCSGSTAGGANGFDPTPEQKAQITNALLLSMLLVTRASAPLQTISTAMFGINPPFIDLGAFLEQAEAQLERLNAKLAETERDRRLIQEEIDERDTEQRRILRGILHAEQIEAPVSQDSVRRYNELVDQLSRARDFIFKTLDPQIKDLKERIRLTERAIDAIKRMQGTTQTGGNATGGGNFAPLSSAPVSFSQGGAGGKQMYVDITALMADPNKGDRLWLNGGARPHGAARPGQASPIRLWAGLNHVDFDDDRTGADRDGDITTFTGGAHYALDPASAVGGYFTYRTGDVSSSAMASTLDSDAFGFGAYATRRLNAEITGSASLEYAHGDHDIAIAGATGNFDTDEFRATAGLKGRYLLSGLIGAELFPADLSWIEPTASISYTNVARDAYTDSTGASVASGNLEQGRISAGPVIRSAYVGEGEAVATVSPHLGLLGHWDFINEGDFAVGTGTVVQTPDFGASIGGGINVAFVGQVSLALASQYYFTDTAFDAWSVSLGGSVPIATLGMFGDRAGGFAKLELKGTPGTGTAALRVSLPLN